MKCVGFRDLPAVEVSAMLVSVRIDWTYSRAVLASKPRLELSQPWTEALVIMALICQSQGFVGWLAEPLTFCNAYTLFLTTRDPSNELISNLCA